MLVEHRSRNASSEERFLVPDWPAMFRCLKQWDPIAQKVQLLRRLSAHHDTFWSL